jgi:hypothetical protein
VPGLPLPAMQKARHQQPHQQRHGTSSDMETASRELWAVTQVTAFCCTRAGARSQDPREPRDATGSDDRGNRARLGGRQSELVLIRPAPLPHPFAALRRSASLSSRSSGGPRQRR